MICKKNRPASLAYSGAPSVTKFTRNAKQISRIGQQRTVGR
jgi:hypothetical protein